jgi:IS30 family transposase
MPRYAPNKSPASVKRRYFELIRTGLSGSAAAQRVGVSLSCGSLWFIDAGSVNYIERPISRRYLSQDDRIEIADGLTRGESVKVIAVRIGKSYQSIYREITRNRRPDGCYQPWYAHNRAYLRRRRPKPRRLAVEADLRQAVAGKLIAKWSPGQISRWLRRCYRHRTGWHVCAETIYEAVYRGLILPAGPHNLRTGRTYRRRRGRGRTGDRHARGAQDPVHAAGGPARHALCRVGRRCPDRRVQHTPERAASHVDLGPRQRNVPPRTDRDRHRTQDLLC